MEKLIILLLNSSFQTHIWHLQTKPYGDTHKALGMLYDGISEHADTIAECAMSDGPRISIPEDLAIELVDFESVEQVQSHLSELCALMDEVRETVHSSVQNKIDDAHSFIRKIKFLLTYK